MEGILNNGLNYIPNIKQTLKELISNFWQPSMEKKPTMHNTTNEEEPDDYQKPGKGNKGKQKPKKEINKKRHLSLENIMVLHVEGKYMITMWGLKQNNCDERITLTKGKSERTIIERCLEDNTELERRKVTNYLEPGYEEIYNEALNKGNYECCLRILRGLEAHLNQKTNEKNKQLILGGKQ